MSAQQQGGIGKEGEEIAIIGVVLLAFLMLRSGSAATTAAGAAASVANTAAQQQTAQAGIAAGLTKSIAGDALSAFEDYF